MPSVAQLALPGSRASWGAGAIHAQIDRVAYAHTSRTSTELAEALADTLVATGTSHACVAARQP